jgi:phosphinothricin acetyltransferase
VEVSVYLRDGRQREGIGRGPYRELFRILTRQRFVVASTGIVLPNPASVGVYESLGFTPVGVYRVVGYKYGAWHNMVWYSRELASREVPLGEVRGPP